MRDPGARSGSFWWIAASVAPARNADQHPFLARRAQRPRLGVLGRDLDDAVEQLRVEVARDEPRADALDRVRPRLPARNHRRQRRLDREHLHLRPDRLQRLGDAGDVAAGADAGDHRVDRQVVEVLEDLARGGLDVDGDIGRVVELAGHPAVRRRGDDLVRAFDRRLHAARRAGSGRTSRRRRASAAAARSTSNRA